MDAEGLVALIRDLTIILFAMIGVLVLVLGTLLGWLLYRKVVPILDSTKAVTKQAQEASSLISEKVVKPMVAASTFSYSAGRIVGFILGLSRGKGGRKDGK